MFCSLAVRLESQMTSDIQAILQLLQRQTTAGPPAYSTVTSEYQSPAIRVQPVSGVQTDLSLAPAPPRPQVLFTLLQRREEGNLGVSYSRAQFAKKKINEVVLDVGYSVTVQLHCQGQSTAGVKELDSLQDQEGDPPPLHRELGMQTAEGPGGQVAVSPRMLQY